MIIQGCTDEEFAIHCPTEMTLTPCPTIEPPPATTLGPLYDAQGRFIGAVERALRFGRRSINQLEGFSTESPYAKRERFTGEAGRALRFDLRRSSNNLWSFCLLYSFLGEEMNFCVFWSFLSWNTSYGSASVLRTKLHNVTQHSVFYKCANIQCKTLIYIHLKNNSVSQDKKDI